MSENKFVQKIEKKEIATQSERAYTPYISKADLVVPRLQLMQAMSDKVAKHREAFAGEIRDNLVNDLFAKEGEQLAFTPVHAETIWMIHKEKLEGKKKVREFIGVEKVTPENEFAPYEEDLGDGWTQVRTKQIELYVLLDKDPTIPYIVSFAKTSIKAGKKALTQMYLKNVTAGLDVSAVKMWLMSKQEQGDQGAYYVYDIGIVGKATEEEQASALQWYKSITSGQIRTEVEHA